MAYCRTKRAKEDFGNSLRVIETYLRKDVVDGTTTRKRTYLVNPQKISLADIVLSCTLLYPFTLVFDEEYLKPYSYVVRWFTKCFNQPEFIAVVGKIKLYKTKY
jgi:glutathione S-transferase